MRIKKCFIVMGAESSGNRMLAGILQRAGCALYSETIDNSLPIDENPAVVIRSFPHGWQNPDLRIEIAELRNRGYNPMGIVTVRDHSPTICSQVKHRLHTFSKAESNIRDAYIEIFSQLKDCNIDFRISTYESLISNPAAILFLLKDLCLDISTVDAPIVVDGQERFITDENRKYYDLE